MAFHIKALVRRQDISAPASRSFRATLAGTYSEGQWSFTAQTRITGGRFG